MHDTHAHLDLYLERLGLLAPEASVLTVEARDRLRQDLAGHDWVVQPTVSLENYLRLRVLFQDLQIPPVYYLLGAHPELVTADFDIASYLEKLETEFTSDAYLIGIGEIGLDYYYTQDSEIIAKQKELFREHIKLALEHDLPVIIHCRDAFPDVFAILDEFPQLRGRFLIHCFTGGPAELGQVLKRGGLVAYGGVTTFKNARELQATVPVTPAESFVLETDLPYLSPHPHRGETCAPAYVDDTATHLAALRDVEKSRVWADSQVNAVRFFGRKMTREASVSG